jgi:hypothetical protein
MFVLYKEGIHRMNKNHFAELWDILPQTEVVKKGCMYMCLKCLHLGVMVLNFRTVEDNSVSSVQNHLWVMHNRALAHFLVCVRQHINQVFGEKCTGQGGPFAWPSCVLDLNIIDFLCRGL